MVDSIAGAGNAQSLTSLNRTERPREDQVRERPDSTPVDTVEISARAQELSEAQAEETARALSQELNDNQDSSLGSDSSLLDELV